MFERIEEKIIGLFANPDKKQALRQLLAELGLGECDIEAVAHALAKHDKFVYPKNWRALDRLHLLARQAALCGPEHRLAKTWSSTELFAKLIAPRSFGGLRIHDLGCGRTDPLLQSIVLYVNGAASVVASDLEPAFDSAAAAMNMADAIVEFILDQRRWNLFERADFLERCTHFDMNLLRKGDLGGVLGRAPIEYRMAHIQDGPADEAYDLILSFSVLEHVLGIEALSKQIYMRLVPGGMMVNQVDFSDHRQWSPSFNFWTFMTQTGPKQPGVNGLRLSQLLATFESNGFRTIKVLPHRVSMPQSVRDDLLPEFRALSMEDLETVSAYLVLERPH